MQMIAHSKELVDMSRMTPKSCDWTRFNKVLTLFRLNGVGDLCHNFVENLSNHVDFGVIRLNSTSSFE